MRVAVLAGVLGACGSSALETASFVDRYEEAYCERFVACPDPVAVFDGTHTKEGCLADVGPGLRDLADDCAVDVELGDRCLDQLSGVECPAEDEPFDTVVPALCDDVWICDA